MTHPNPHALQRRHMLAALAGIAPPLFASANGRKLQITAIYTVPFEQQWVSRVHQALTKAAHHGQIEYTAFENMPGFQYANAMRRQAKAGCDIIIGEAFEVEEAARHIAAEFPNVQFVMGSSGKPRAPNFSVFDNFIHEPAYLAGMLAGGMSKSGHIGLLGGFAIPEVNRLMNAFMDGAREINPRARFATGEIRSWLNQPRARRMTLRMIDDGVDAMFAATMAGVVETAAEKGILAFGNIVHPQTEYPGTVVASALWNMEPTVQAVLRDAQTSRTTARDYGSWSFMRKGGSSLSSLGRFEKQISPQLLQRVRTREKEILSGEFVVPIKNEIVLTMKDDVPQLKMKLP